MPDLNEKFPAAGRRSKKPAGETPLEAPNSINSNPFPTSDAVSEKAPQFSFPPASQAKGTDSKFSYPASPAAAQAATEEALQSFAPATLADAPSSEDELGFSPYTRALAQFLLNIDTKGPLSVSIEGQWGSGKSSFLLILENDLKKGSAEKVKKNIPHNVPVIAKFNPWRHDNDEALWAAFAVALTKEIVKGQPLFQQVAGHTQLLSSRFDWKHGWLELLKAITVFLIATGLLFSLSAPLSVNLAKSIKSPDYASRISFIEEFHEDFARVVNAFARGKTVFVFVDDLDRSSVARASELMQAINLMISTELKNIIFILAMDREKIAAGVAVKNAELLPYIYPEFVRPSEAKSLPPSVGLQFGFEYLEKFIQIAFPLPKPRAENIDRFLRSLSGPKQINMSSPDMVASSATSKITAGDQVSPATANEDFQIEFSTDSQNVRDVAREVSRFFDDNPRRLKQFVNIFRLRAFVAYETGVLRPGRMTAEQLGKLVAMQLRWPLWTATGFNNPSFLKMLAGDHPLDAATDGDIELKKELIGLGRLNAPPGAAWDLEGADLEAFVRISPVVRAIDVDGFRDRRQQTNIGSPDPLDPRQTQQL